MRCTAGVPPFQTEALIAGLVPADGSQLNPSLGIALSGREPPHPGWCPFLRYNPHCMIGQSGSKSSVPWLKWCNSEGLLKLWRTLWNMLNPLFQLQYSSAPLCPFLFILLIHNYSSWEHFLRTFLYRNIHFKVHFPRNNWSHTVPYSGRSAKIREPHSISLHRGIQVYFNIHSWCMVLFSWGL